MQSRASGSCWGRNTKHREAQRHSSGAARPRCPRAPFLWIAKERGERKLAPGDDAGLLPATRYALPAQMPAHGRRGSRTHRPTPKSPPTRRRQPGAKNAAQVTPQKAAGSHRHTTERPYGFCLAREPRVWPRNHPAMRICLRPVRYRSMVNIDCSCSRLKRSITPCWGCLNVSFQECSRQARRRERKAPIPDEST